MTKPPRLLRGASALYRLALAFRPQKSSAEKRAHCPVLSIGNVVVGGAGKTSVVLLLIELLQSMGYHVHVITRGYGRRIAHGALRVQRGHSAHQVGEEALLLAQKTDTVVARKRSDALLLLDRSFTRSVIVLDDGHQHRSLYKDLSFLVVNQHQKHGNQYVFPAGPLREPLEKAFFRADAVFYLQNNRKDRPDDPFYQELCLWGKPVFCLLSSFTIDLVPGQRVIAFAGLGYHARFYAALREKGFSLVQCIDFPDHHHYTDKDETRLLHLAQKENACLVTTQKDLVKLSVLFQRTVTPLSQELTLLEPEDWKAFIQEKIPLC